MGTALSKCVNRKLGDLRPRPRGAMAVEILESRRLLSSTIFVDAGAHGADNGLSWASAFTNLQSALGVATSGQTIEVAKGTYYPTTGIDRTATFQLIDGVTIQGGYAGNSSRNPDSRNVI